MRIEAGGGGGHEGNPSHNLENVAEHVAGLHEQSDFRGSIENQSLLGEQVGSQPLGAAPGGYVVFLGELASPSSPPESVGESHAKELLELNGDDEPFGCGLFDPRSPKSEGWERIPKKYALEWIILNDPHIPEKERPKMYRRLSRKKSQEIYESVREKYPDTPPGWPDGYHIEITRYFRYLMKFDAQEHTGECCRWPPYEGSILPSGLKPE